jgi:hypothetical protein
MMGQHGPESTAMWGVIIHSILHEPTKILYPSAH